MDFGLTKEQKLLVERVDRLVKEHVAPRAADYDLTLEAPAEDIHELHREGWLVTVNVLVIARTRATITNPGFIYLPLAPSSPAGRT